MSARFHKSPLVTRCHWSPGEQRVSFTGDAGDRDAKELGVVRTLRGSADTCRTVSGTAFSAPEAPPGATPEESPPARTIALATTGSALAGLGSAGPNSVRCGRNALSRSGVIPRTRSSSSMLSSGDFGGV
jgi:hypothetical protein